MSEVSYKGQKTQLLGNLPKVGEKAPNFELVTSTLQTVTLDSLPKTKKILNVFISLDTPVCAKSVFAFHDKPHPNCAIYNISLDLPFASSRFCVKHNLAKDSALSAYRSDFPSSYGVEIAEGPLKGLCTRAVFALDEDNIIRYVELVPEISEEPDYSAARKALGLE